MTCRAALSALLSALTAALGPKVRAVDIDNLQTEITGVNTDTRTIEAGQLFVALEGERFNGHDFAEKAVAGGAIATLTRHGVITADLPRIEVPDTLAAYQALGRWWRRQL
ncbi:MAG: Mur ligase domain-containing protein, partial [Cyanobacteria bacterium J06628_6]